MDLKQFKVEENNATGDSVVPSPLSLAWPNIGAGL